MLKLGHLKEKLMVNSSIEELFNSIENSALYKKYMQMNDILSKDMEIRNMLDEIKRLEKEATYLENIGDERYIEVDNEIKRKAEILNNNCVYQEYLNSMDDFNDELSISSRMIESYISEKV
jgi:cell fate (sporulation/competence/biofilm development) regulator YmcA (YheA/YmcA/DUF963 family)